MIRKLLAILVLVFGLYLIADSYSFSPTGMVVEDMTDLDYALENKDLLVEQYNANLEDVPNFVKTIFGNEKMDVTIEKENREVIKLSVETRKGRIVKITEDRFNDYTLEVTIKEKTVNKIISSEDQIASLKKAIDAGEIRYKALSFGTTVKTGISRIFLSIFSWFN